MLQREREALLRVESLQRQEALKLAQVESDARNAQLALLRYQLNPHFLFNTLNSVNALISKGDAGKATKMINKLSEFFRHSLRAEPETEVTVAEEIATTELYLEIEKTRFADRLTVEIQIADSAKSRLVPSMILQPLVENSLKHAIGLSERGGQIRILASEADSGALQLRVEDSGPEVSDHQSYQRPPGASVGLDNTRARLQAFYGDGGRLKIEQADIGGCSVLVEVPPSGARPAD
jgi:LytS/YehU family sensor histidine kinase